MLKCLLKESLFFALDHYKPGKKILPTLGGFSIIFGIIIGWIFSLLISQDLSYTIYLLLVIIFGFFGILDDLILGRVSRYLKIPLLFILALPVSIYVSDSSVFFFDHSVNFGNIYPMILAPIYVMVVANLINLHSGLNGQSMGLSLILSIAILIKSVLSGKNIIPLMPLIASLIAFIPYNTYPAKIFEANTAQFGVGAYLGSILIINKLELFGLIILIPHIVNFLMDTWVLLIRRVPDRKFGHIKSGKIIIPESVKHKSIKFWLESWLGLGEKNTVNLIHFLTIIFAVIGVLI